MERKSAWSLPMSEQEIVNEYKNAKKPQSQIAILADQNGCDKKTIVNILELNGCELPGNFKKKKKEQPLAETEAAPEEAPDFAKVQSLNEEQEANYKMNGVSLSHEVLRARAYIKAEAYDTIISLYPESLDDGTCLDFVLAIDGIRAFVSRLIREA